MLGGDEDWKIYNAKQVEKFRESVADSVRRVVAPFTRTLDSVEGEVYTRLRGDWQLRKLLGWYPSSKPRRQTRDHRELLFAYLLRNLVIDGLINRHITELMLKYETLAKYVAPEAPPDLETDNVIPINPR